jgi:hypothetical protein
MVHRLVEFTMNDEVVWLPECRTIRSMGFAAQLLFVGSRYIEMRSLDQTKILVHVYILRRLADADVGRHTWR